MPLDALSKLLSLPESEKTDRGFAHTAAEIAQQPSSWLSTFDLFRHAQADLSRFLSQAGIAGGTTFNLTVFLIGAGTSDYIGQSLAYLLRRSWQCAVLAIPSTDLLTHMEQNLIAGGNYLWISFSRSGESPEGVAVLRRARQLYPGIHHIVISCNADGRMLRESGGDSNIFGICLDDAVNDRSLAMTSSFTNMVVAGQCLANIADLPLYENLLRRIVAAADNLMPRAADCADSLANLDFPKTCFVGSGPLRAVTLESSLKLLEMTAGKTWTMSESALGLRHGPMAALDQSTLFVCFISGNPLVQAYERDLLDEISAKRLVRSRVAVGGAPGTIDASRVESHLSFPSEIDLPDDYRPPVDIIFGQLLGLFFSLRRGLRPDSPSPTGTISRVVQDFSIHDESSIG